MRGSLLSFLPVSGSTAVIRHLKSNIQDCCLITQQYNSPFPNYAPLLKKQNLQVEARCSLFIHVVFLSTWPRLDAFVCRQWSVIRKWAITFMVIRRHHLTECLFKTLDRKEKKKKEFFIHLPLRCFSPCVTSILHTSAS